MSDDAPVVPEKGPAPAADDQPAEGMQKVSGVHLETKVDRSKKVTKTEQLSKNPPTKEAQKAKVVEKQVGKGKKVAGVFLEDAIKAEHRAQKPAEPKQGKVRPDAGGQMNVPKKDRTKVSGVSV